jgi:short-subunit dehydrogenase
LALVWLAFKIGFNLVLLARSRNKPEELARELMTAHGIKAAVVAADWRT